MKGVKACRNHPGLRHRLLIGICFIAVRRGMGCALLSARIADSSSRNAVSFSSARTTKRFPSSRCASAIQIVCPLELIVDTRPQLQPALLRLSAIVSQYVTGVRDFCLPVLGRYWKEITWQTLEPRGPEESSRINLFHLCFGCGVQIERVQ